MTCTEVHEERHHSHHLVARTHQEASDAAVEGTGKPLTLGHDARPDHHPHGDRPQPNDLALMGHPVAGPHLHHSDANRHGKSGSAKAICLTVYNLFMSLKILLTLLVSRQC